MTDYPWLDKEFGDGYTIRLDDYDDVILTDDSGDEFRFPLDYVSRLIVRLQEVQE